MGERFEFMFIIDVMIENLQQAVSQRLTNDEAGDVARARHDRRITLSKSRMKGRASVDSLKLAEIMQNKWNNKEAR